jgi:hypothetical protein
MKIRIRFPFLLLLELKQDDRAFDFLSALDLFINYYAAEYEDPFWWCEMGETRTRKASIRLDCPLRSLVNNDSAIEVPHPRHLTIPQELLTRLTVAKKGNLESTVM